MPGRLSAADKLGCDLPVGLVQLSRQSMTTFLIGSFAVIVISSLLAGWLLNSFCREAAGSGIPQLKLAFWKGFGTVPRRVLQVTGPPHHLSHTILGGPFAACARGTARCCCQRLRC